MAKFTAALMKKVAPTISQTLRDEITTWLNYYCPKYHITTELRASAFLANFMEECARFSRFDENLNYSAGRLMKVWPRRFPDLTTANKYAHNPQKLANYVYNGRNGNIPGTDDGWVFRGGGAGQTTGRGNYKATGEHMGLDLVQHPELLRIPKNAIWSACVEWERRGCNELADKRRLRDTRKAINGGYNGMANVEAFYAQVMSWLPDGFRLDNSPKSAPSSVAEFRDTPVFNESEHTPDSVDAEDNGTPSWHEASDAESVAVVTENKSDGSNTDSSDENGSEQTGSGVTNQKADMIANVSGAGSASGGDSEKKIEAAAKLPDTIVSSKIKTGFNKIWGTIVAIGTGSLILPDWIQQGITLDSFKIIGGFIWELRYFIFGSLALWFVVVKLESLWLRKKVIDTNTDPEKGNVGIRIDDEPTFFTRIQRMVGW